MVNLRVLFGWVPKTTEYEGRQEALRKEFSEFNEFSRSGELAGYLELEKTVLSPEFALRKKEITGSRYSGTPEFLKERNYKALKNNREIRHYYKTKDSVELRDFLEFDKSYDLKHFNTLENFVESDDFLRRKKELGKRKFKKAPEYEKFLEYRALKKSARIRHYFKFKRSGDYVNFTLMIGSEKITNFEQLEKYIRSDEFRKVKEYRSLPGRKKWEMSEEFRQQQKYRELKGTDRIKWYFKTRNSKKFDEIKRWNLSFSDEFDAHPLDKKKWLTRYFWGEALLHDSYVNEGEKQFFPDEQNIQISNSILKITTRKQKYSGKSWSPSIGFYPHEFDYTAGIINSGGKFRQLYGRFEAKIRFNLNHPVSHGFWMISDLMLPQIDIARASKKIRVGTYFGNPNVKGGVDKQAHSMSRSMYGSDFQVFSLEWSRERLTWKINGVPICSTTRGVPQVPMYINISSSLYQDVNGSVLPADVEVDWVRCYSPV